VNLRKTEYYGRIPLRNLAAADSAISAIPAVDEGTSLSGCVQVPKRSRDKYKCKSCVECFSPLLGNAFRLKKRPEFSDQPWGPIQPASNYSPFILRCGVSDPQHLVEVLHHICPASFRCGLLAACMLPMPKTRSAMQESPTVLVSK